MVGSLDCKESKNAISSDTVEARPVVLKLLGGMATVYPSFDAKMRDDFSADATEAVWTMALEDYEPTVIMEAFKAIVKGRGAHDRFPPTAVHYGMICKDIQMRNGNKVLELPRKAVMEKTDEDCRRGKEWISKCKKILAEGERLTNKQEI